MKQKLPFFFLFLSLTAFSQVEFEQGYFITQDDEKVQALIKNEDWKSNPSTFQFKTSETSEVQTATFGSVKQFAIDNKAKYQLFNVPVDTSRSKLQGMGNSGTPAYSEKIIFLETLVEGAATLFKYTDENIDHYFYQLNDGEVIPLEYKRYQYEANSGIGYSTSKTTIRENQRYKQQLLNDLKCEGIITRDVSSLNYTENSLTDFFIEYNKCIHSDFKEYQKNRRVIFNLNLKPGANFASMEFNRANKPSLNFGSQATIRFGLEAEFILPFKRNKWAVVFEPNYRHFKEEKRVEDVNTPYYTDYDFDVKLLELPLGVRHYMFLSERSKLFVNAFLSINLDAGSKIQQVRHNNPETLEVSTTSFTGAFGIGYDYENYSLEARYNPAVNLFGSYKGINTEYGGFSIILGYTIL